MERFIEFTTEVSVTDLNQALSNHNPGVMILRVSKLTGTVKVRADDRLSKKDLKRAFSPYKIRKIYSEFPLER